MKNKKFIKNLIYLILIFVFFVTGLLLQVNHKIQSQRTYDYNIIYITFVIIIFFGGIGALLALSTTNFSIKKFKKLKFNKEKLLLIGLPSFVTSMTYIWLYFGLLDKIAFLHSNVIDINYLITFSSIVLGHTIISSISTDFD